MINHNNLLNNSQSNEQNVSYLKPDSWIFTEAQVLSIYVPNHFPEDQIIQKKLPDNLHS